MKPLIETVPVEYSNGLIGGSIYANSCRIMLRSPTHVIFHCRGAKLWLRGREGWHGMTTLTTSRPTKAFYELTATQEKIDAALGEGVGLACLAAYRDKQTVLLNGGGAKMQEPGILLRKRHQSAYADNTINWTLDLTGKGKTCLQCGAGLRPHTILHHLARTIEENHPRSVEDCQRLTNFQVVSIRDFGMGDSEKFGYVSWFETWDGETMVDPHFCNDRCAAKYGRRAAQSGLVLEVGVEPEKPASHAHESVNHFVAEERTLVTSDGKVFKL